MRLALQRYDSIVKYLPGTKNLVADALSRVPVDSNGKSVSERILRIEMESSKIYDGSKISDPLLKQIQEHSRKDEVAQRIKRAIEAKWTTKADNNLEPFLAFPHELIWQDDLLFKGSACFVPRSLRADFFRRIHRTHLARDAMFRRARDTIFWSGLKQDFEAVVSNCTACQTYSIKQHRESMIIGELPTHPWDIMHQDLMEWSGQQYLVTRDGYSGYFDFFKLGTSAKTRQVISVTKRLFAAFGRPRQFRTDSDPRYLWGEFREFMSPFQIQHNVSAAHHHQSNGRAEAGVKVAKILVKKSEFAKEDIELALLVWRNTPQEDGFSPAEKFFCRKARSLLPVRVSADRDSQRTFEVQSNNRESDRRRTLTKGRKFCNRWKKATKSRATHWLREAMGKRNDCTKIEQEDVRRPRERRRPTDSKQSFPKAELSAHKIEEKDNRRKRVGGE